MKKYNDRMYSRNYGYWNESEQQLICNSHIAIAGVGGDGFQLGLNLVRMGVQNFSVADPEVFEKENFNRVPGATISGDGRNKAEVFREMAQEINPDIKIDIYKDGVNESNVHDFMRKANLLIDESEIRYSHICIMLARAARKLIIPNMTVMNIGFAGIATSFDPCVEKGHATLEGMMGVSADTPLDEIKDMDINLDCFLPYIPYYGDVEVLKAVNEGAPLPSIVHGVNIAAGIGATQAFLHLVSPNNNNRPKPVWASHFIYNDSYTNHAGIIKIPKMSHYIGLSKVIVRSAININPHASYSEDSRKSRQ